MIIKGRSHTLRRVSRTCRVALDWLFVRINLDTKIQVKYVDTKNQLADILTKGSFSKVWELCGSGFRQSAVDHNRLVLALLLWYRLCCVFLCRRRTSEWGRTSARGGRQVRQPRMRHVTPGNKTLLGAQR